MYRARPASYLARRIAPLPVRRRRRVPLGRAIALVAMSWAVAVQVVSANDGNGGAATDTVVINVLAPGATAAPTAVPTAAPPAAALPDTLTTQPDGSTPLLPAGFVLLALAAASALVVPLRRRPAIARR